MFISTLTFYNLLPLLNIMQSVSNSMFSILGWFWLFLSSLKRIHVRSWLFFCIFLFMIPQFQPLISTKIDHVAKCILVGTKVFLVCNIPVFLCFLIYFCHFLSHLLILPGIHLLRYSYLLCSFLHTYLVIVQCFTLFLLRFFLLQYNKKVCLFLLKFFVHANEPFFYKDFWFRPSCIHTYLVIVQSV